MPRWTGKCSWFGGPDDLGVSPEEGLAFLYEIDDAPELFLEEQPEDTTGLARRLDPDMFYIAMRWDYDDYTKDMLASGDLMAVVYSPASELACLARPADWGPAEETDRIADLSPAILEALGLETDDEVEIIFPVMRNP